MRRRLQDMPPCGLAVCRIHLEQTVIPHIILLSIFKNNLNDKSGRRQRIVRNNDKAIHTTRQKQLTTSCSRLETFSMKCQAHLLKVSSLTPPQRPLRTGSVSYILRRRGTKEDDRALQSCHLVHPGCLQCLEDSKPGHKLQAWHRNAHAITCQTHHCCHQGIGS
jgi:hypothetical protein